MVVELVLLKVPAVPAKCHVSVSVGKYISLGTYFTIIVTSVMTCVTRFPYTCLHSSNFHASALIFL